MRLLSRAALLTAVAFCFSCPVSWAATCYGHADCRACKNCRYCGHCAKRGGSCGVCSPAAYQPPTRPAPAAKPVDLGIDLAIVNVSAANLREGPGTDTAVILKLKGGNTLALIDRQKTGSWYNVIHIDSGKEGWIESSLVRIQYTRKKQEVRPFQAEPGEDQESLTVTVSNDTKKPLALKLGDERHSIPPGEKRTLYPPQGSYPFYAAVPGVLPAFGKEEFRLGTAYTWRFYISTVRSRR